MYFIIFHYQKGFCVSLGKFTKDGIFFKFTGHLGIYKRKNIRYTSRSVVSELLVTPRTATYQAPPSMGFSRQEYWSGVPLPSPKIHKDRYEYEISHNQHSAIFHDPWILSLKSETSEMSDEGKLGSSFIKVILVIWRLLKTKIFIQEKNNSETSSAYWNEIKLIIQIAHFYMQHKNSVLDITLISMSGKEMLKGFFTMKSNRNLKADKSKPKVLLFLTENIYLYLRPLLPLFCFWRTG